MNELEFAELAAGHALGSLTPADEQRYLTALAAHPEWSRYADQDAATVAAIADSIAPVAPPPALRDSLLAALDATPQRADAALAVGEDAPDALAVDPDTPPSSDTPIAGRTRSGWSRAWFALAASLALILAVAGITTVVAQTNRAPALVALERIESAPDAQQASAEIAGGGDAVLHWSESLGEAVIVASALPRISADQTFEAWLIRDGTPLPAGTFEAGTGAGTAALLDSGLQPGDLVALTVEPNGGAPDGVPTSDPIVAIETS